MEFLYFPTDKSEYIPAFITLVIFMIGAVAAMYLIYIKSKKDEAYYDEKYKDQDYYDEKYKDQDFTNDTRKKSDEE